MIIDTHCHINDDLLIEKANDIIENFEKDKLTGVICIGCNAKSNQLAVKLSENEKVFASVGIHPEFAEEFTDNDIYTLKTLAENKKVVAIGEIGLDYHYDTTFIDEQKRAFISQLKLADELKLPVIIHTRDAWKDTLDILDEYQNYLNSGVVIHCYSGSVEIARELVKKGYYISFNGNITYKNSKKAVEVIRQIDLKHILVETDCPYLTPEQHRGELNEPKNVHYVVEKIAEIKDYTTELVEEICNGNARNLFKKLTI